MADITQTLGERQKKIVDLLMEYDGHMSSAEIRHYLDAPKATLSRDLNELEEKKIVDTVHVGRNRNVRLTKWFLDV